MSTKEAVKQALESGMISHPGKNLTDHLNSLREGQSMLVTPHKLSEGRGYTILTIETPTEKGIS